MTVNRVCAFVLISLLVILHCCGLISADKRIVCYFESWAVYRPGKGIFDVENIDTSLCTHGMYGFAGLDAATNKIISLDPYNDFMAACCYHIGCIDKGNCVGLKTIQSTSGPFDDCYKYVETTFEEGAYVRFTNLSKKNPNFVPMLSVGGWNEGSVKYSKMASTSANRKAFVDSVVDFLQKYGFRGLDLDWEYPTQRGGQPEDKENYVQLLKELREAFDPHGMYLSAAVSAGKENIDAAYNIPEVSKYLHFINLMTYDYHGDWEPYTGLNAPLYPRPDEYDDNRLLNVNFSVHYWIARGAPAEKINLGLATYGRTFTLANSKQHGFYDPVNGAGEAGPYTEEKGDLGYNEICEAMMAHPEWPVIRDEYYRAPYTYHGDQWIGYDDSTSIREKCEFANSMNLGGAMVWAIDTDDYWGTCGGGKYVLMNVINEVIRGGATPAPTTPYTGSTTTSRTRSTTMRSTTTESPLPTYQPSAVCKKPGFQADPNDCSIFYNCVLNPDGTWTAYQYSCQGGTVFDPSIDSCNFPDKVPDCHADI